MRLNSINLKLLALIAGAFMTAAASVLVLADKYLTEITDESQRAVYTEKADAILALLQRNDERLKKTGMAEAYLEDFQDSSVATLRPDYHANSSSRVYPFIMTTAGKVVMHPTLATGDTSLVSTGIVKKLLAGEAGEFEFFYQGERKWYLYKKFASWNWVVVYAVPLEVKYRDVIIYRTLLGYIVAGISLVVLLVLSVIITRFTSPIRKLTAIAQAMAAGDLSQPINISGGDEVGTLAHSFSHMRDAVRSTIADLESENREREKAQQSLAVEKERLAVTLRSIGDGVITTDVSGSVVLLNKVSEKLTGWSASEAVGRPLAEVFHIVNERTRAQCDNPFTKVMDSGQIVGLANHTVLISKDGTERSIADSGAPIFDEGGGMIGVVLVFRDVSEELKREAEQFKVKKLESVGVLAGGIAHDFNNILAVILGNINLSLLDDTLGGGTRDLLASVEKASLRAKDLTQQLLTFAKGGDPVMEASSLEDVITDSAEFVLHGGKVACSYTIPDDLWLVDIDRGQMSQVVQNIVMNACHAMPDGGRITIDCKNVTALEAGMVPNAQAEKYVKIAIGDSGAGIPDSVIEKIFDPYFSTKQEGSGLGLAITQSIIRKHNGHIYVDSDPGKGTTFTIFLPASEEGGRLPQEPRPEIWVPGGQAARIMIMDDDPMVGQIAEKMLTYLGYEVLLVPDGDRALARYQQAMDEGDAFDLVIMDLTIPGGMGGQQAVQEVLKMNPQAKVIVSSGYSNDPIMANYRKYGFKAAMTKPYPLQQLSTLIEQLLSNNA